MDDPRAWIAKFNQLDIPHIVLDRVPIAEDSDRDVLTVQKVPSHIYEASYPAWFFSEAPFLAAFTNYRVAGTFPSQYDDNQWVGGRRCRFRGYVMERVTRTGV